MRLIIRLLFLAAAGVSVLAVGEFETIRQTGPLANRINFLFLAEGYNAEQRDQFRQDVLQIQNDFFQQEPFNAYRDYFNVFSVFVASAETGSDHPSRGVFKNTYFNSSFESDGTPQKISIPPSEFDSDSTHGIERVRALARAFLPQPSFTILLVNDAEYGGAGGEVAIASRHSFSSELALHELGHTFAGLGEEYGGGGGIAHEAPNTTRERARDRIKWKAWIEASTPAPTPAAEAYALTVGLFEGANFNYQGWYRPKWTCKMRELGVPFCEICRETFVLSIYDRLRLLDDWTPLASPVELRPGELRPFEIKTLQPLDHDLIVQWLWDGQQIPGADGKRFELSRSDLGSVSHLLEVRVSDPTRWVRSYPMDTFADGQQWEIRPAAGEILPALKAAREGNGLRLSWPDTFSGFQLEFSQKAPSGAVWNVVPSPIEHMAGEFYVEVAPIAVTGFYRLRKNG